MAEARPRPAVATTSVVLCPACGHTINEHRSLAAGFSCLAGDGCEWTPNDIAWDLLFYGQLTRRSS